MGNVKTRGIFGLAAALAAVGLVAGCETKTEGGPTPARVAQELEASRGGGASAAQPAAPAAPAEPVAVTAEARAEAEQIFTSRCVACHGPTGSGEGPTAAALNPKPRNFHDPAWQKSVNDAHIERIIVAGGPAVGKSPLMPPNPDLQTKPAVVAALREKIRGFGQ